MYKWVCSSFTCIYHERKRWRFWTSGKVSYVVHQTYRKGGTSNVSYRDYLWRNISFYWLLRELSNISLVNLNRLVVNSRREDRGNRRLAIGDTHIHSWDVIFCRGEISPAWICNLQSRNFRDVCRQLNTEALTVLNCAAGELSRGADTTGNKTTIFLRALPYALVRTSDLMEFRKPVLQNVPRVYALATRSVVS